MSSLQPSLPNDVSPELQGLSECLIEMNKQCRELGFEFFGIVVQHFPGEGTYQARLSAKLHTGGFERVVRHLVHISEMADAEVRAGG